LATIRTEIGINIFLFNYINYIIYFGVSNSPIVYYITKEINSKELKNNIYNYNLHILRVKNVLTPYFNFVVEPSM